jgi:formylmethanofuran dehydrogenase subunit E
MGLVGMAALGYEAPMTGKVVLVIIESDGCFASGIEVATGASVCHRTLRVVDMGKVAATFADMNSGRAIRLAPTRDVRQRVLSYACDEKNPYTAQLLGYQVMPDVELFTYQEVVLKPSVESLVSRPSIRVNCDLCGEEIINERELVKEGEVLCQSCAGNRYYV